MKTGIMMKQIPLLFLFFFWLTGPVAAQDQNQRGWIEGTVHTADGKAAGDPAKVIVVRKGKQVGFAYCNKSLDGLFEIYDLTPGIYEIRVHHWEKGWRPQRIFGVGVKPGVRSTLNIILNEGRKIEEIGQPIIATQPALIISQELARLGKEIDALKNK